MSQPLLHTIPYSSFARLLGRENNTILYFILGTIKLVENKFAHFVTSEY